MFIHLHTDLTLYSKSRHHKLTVIYLDRGGNTAAKQSRFTDPDIQHTGYCLMKPGRKPVDYQVINLDHQEKPPHQGRRNHREFSSPDIPQTAQGLPRDNVTQPINCNIQWFLWDNNDPACLTSLKSVSMKISLKSVKFTY